MTITASDRMTSIPTTTVTTITIIIMIELADWLIVGNSKSYANPSSREQNSNDPEKNGHLETQSPKHPNPQAASSYRDHRSPFYELEWMRTY